ncbi:hypothetical protein ACEQ8H_004095 [Pleosporales sp. CAS-2024a]
MKVNPAPLHMAQKVLTGLVLVMSLAILGTSAHTLDVFNKQSSTNPWWAPLWSEHFDTHGTKALIASAVVTLVLSAVFLVMNLLPKLALGKKHTLRALVALGTTLPSFALTLMTTVWAHILNSNAPDRDTIQTWTCRFANDRPEVGSSQVASHLSNDSFKSVCQESKFALWGTLIVFLLLGASTGVAVVTWCADKWAARQARKEGVETIHMTAKA